MKFFGKELKFNNNKVYHAGDKPTPSEIGAAAASHGTHVTWATTAPKANGTAAVGTVARVAREDHVHPLQTSVSGNAGTATVWQNARTLTIGNTGKSVNGSANVSWSLNEIGAAPGKTASATTAATAQWYRIATSPAGMNRCIGNFTIEATVSGKHSVTNLIAGVNYGINPTIQQLAHSDYSAAGITKARIVYHTTYNNNYAYLEVYQPTATATQINVSAVNLVGWTLVAPNTVGSIPSGYTSKEITFVNNKIVANIQGSVSGSASSATKATQDSAGQQINTTYIKGLSVSGKTITYTKGDGTTGTITTQDTNTTYSTGTASALGLTKLYTGTGTATDGTMTQAAIKSALDGKANSSHGRHVPDVCATITDWNSATTNGWYMANNAANAPTTGVWYFGEVIAHNTNYVFQTVYQFNASSDAKGIPKYIRAKMNGTWGAWTNVTVAKAVPSNAVFTDTNTWRGVQNNLTSDATDQSLSAAQGKVLKGLVDGKAASSHTHNYAGSSSAGGAANSVKTSLAIKLNGGTTEGTNLFTFNGSTAKTVNITASSIGAASSGHTHNYAGSSSPGGNANAAVKLATPRTIKIGNTSRTFDGTGNITWTAADMGVASINDSTTATGSVWSSNKTQTQINTSYNTMTKRVEALEETIYSDFVSKSGDTMSGDLTIKKPDGSAAKIKVYRTINSKSIEASMDIYNYDGGSAAINTWDRTAGTQMANYVFGGIALFAADVPSGKRPELGLSNYRFEKAWLNKLDVKDAMYTGGTLTVQGKSYLGSTILANNHSLYGKKTDGTNLINICGVDTSNNIYLGWGNETYIDVNNTMRTSRDIHVMNGAAMRVTGHLNVARTTDYTQLATFQTAGDSNAQGDGQTHIGYFNSGWGGYTHYFRGGGPVIIDNLNSLQISRDWFRLGGKYVYLRSATPNSGLQVGDIWIQI